MSKHWASPAPGDIVWCMFPEVPDSAPGPKPRPALVVGIESREDGGVVRVAYGTSQHVTRLKTGEVAITQQKHPAAYALAGLAYDTKFDLKVIVELPWSDRYFKAPLRNRHGNTPKIGTLHVTMLRAVEAAYRAAVSR
jgi:mRNA-degrading endonuclease toxin of MazEF toxin-antitoxin module